MRTIVLSMLLAVFMSCGAFAAAADGSEIASCSVKVVTLTPDGGHLDVLWKDNGLIVFDRRGEDGYFDIWTMRKDGTDQKNLTSGKDALPGRHVGGPEWHPSGKWIVFQAQKSGMPAKYDNIGVPGAGVLNDLWLMTDDGSSFWKLIDLPLDFKNWPGILHPHFSHDGRQLVWAQRVGRGKSPFGAWVIKLANFNFEDTKPFLSEIETLTPGQKGRSQAFYETHGFSPDGRKIIFSSDFEKGLNIYVMDLETRVVRNLTNSRDWDEHALFSPDGTKIAWMSSRGLRFRARPFLLETEWWMMDADGNNKNRLTYFHKKGHLHYREITEKNPLAIAADIAWEKDGKHLVGLVIHGDPGGKKRGTGEIVRITLNSIAPVKEASKNPSGETRGWRLKK